MSLDVPPALLERAQQGEVDDADFVDCVRLSLPYAWQVISGVVAELAQDGHTSEFADHEIPPPSESARGQLLRALASDAIRGGLERHFGVSWLSRTATVSRRSGPPQPTVPATGPSSPRAVRCSTRVPSCATADHLTEWICPPAVLSPL
jgi:hypothetical protein